MLGLSGCRGSNLDCSGLVEATASLLQGMGQLGAQQNVQRVLKLVRGAPVRVAAAAPACHGRCSRNSRLPTDPCCRL